MSKTKKSDQLRTLRIGSRLRCTDDGATGTITWANGSSVKIKWDDGEQVTWKRDSLPDRPIQVVGADEKSQPEASAPDVASTDVSAALATEAALDSDASDNKKAKASSKPKRQRKATAEPKTKISALDAAARVLQENGRAMNCQELIEAMSAKGYWTTPGGKTPQATLYSAILRELKTKGQDARFKKSDRGKFVSIG